MRAKLGVHRLAAATGVAIVMGAALGVGGWAPSAHAQDQHIVVMASNGAPDSLNPFATYGAFWPTIFSYDFLFGIDAQRHDDRKGFAQSESHSADGRTWTFKIWPDMKWSDGQPATARDVAFTYNYLRNSIGKPDELNAGWNNTSGTDAIDSITVVDDQTVEITMKTPSTWPIDNTLLIVPEHVWKSISYADARASFQNPPPIVGTGPMIIQQWQKGQYFRMTANPYFRNGKPPADGMIYEFFDSNDPIVQGLKRGEIDDGESLSAAQWADLKNTPNIVVGESKIEQTDFLAFNTLGTKGGATTNAVADPAFRDAVGYAIDQNVIVDRALQGHGDPGVGVIVPVAKDYFSDLSDIARHFDLAEAGRRLDAAGYKLNSSGVRVDKEGNPLNLQVITGRYAGTNPIPTATVELISGWLKQIGIPTAVTRLDSGALLAKSNTPKNGGGGWDLLIGARYYSSYPVDLLNVAASDQAGTGNLSYWSNPQYDQLRNQVSQTVDVQQRKPLVDQATRLEYQQAPYIFLDYPVNLDAHRTDRFEGWGTEDNVSQWSYFPFDRLKPISGAAASSGAGSGGSPGPAQSGATNAPEEATSSGAPVGAIALVALVVVVAVAGLFIASRRRKSA